MQARRSHASIVDEEFGLVRWIAEVPQSPGDPKIFNYAVKLAATDEYLPLRCFTNNGGAGLTREGAYRAALGEAVERYCSSAFFKEDLIFGTYAEIQRGGRAIGPGDIALFHPAQREHIHYSWFTESTKLCWRLGRSLTHGDPVYVPASLVHVPYYGFYRDEGEESIGPGISTGQASGYSEDAALLSGLYEVIERDAVSILWLNRLPVPKIDVASSPALAAIVAEHFERDGIECTLFDMTLDIAVPSVFALMIDRTGPTPMICTGGATHSNPEHAAEKALVEAAQTLQWARYLGKRDAPFIIEPDYANIDDFEKHVYLYGYGNRLRSFDFLIDSARTVALDSLPGAAYDSTADELRGVRTRVEARGYEVLAVDLTTVDVAECGFSVAKVLVPQLQQLEGDHRHRFLGGPRIYDVPPLLGYPAIRDPRGLNPEPHPYP